MNTLKKPPLPDSRLRAAGAFVREGRRAADVGCDHGQLICSLALEGKIPGGVACDINEGPLAVARAQIEECGLSGRISTALCDGLSKIPPDMADDIIITGMGGELIFSIIQAAPWLQDPDKRLILGPMSRPEWLRHSLYAAGFYILAETAAEAGGRLYSIIHAAFCGKPRALTLAEALCGALPKSGEALAMRLLLQTAGHQRRIARGLLMSGGKQNEAASREALAAEIEKRAREGIAL